MPPKKKSNKKGKDDWENELGETPDPIAVASQAAKDDDAAKDAAAEAEVGGSLLAALKKNRKQKVKKGKIAPENEELAGEDPPAANGVDENGTLENKAPDEADADDLFGAVPMKGKGGKANKAQSDAKAAADEADEDAAGQKSRKEKEKEKKEKEKQRKKEQVRHGAIETAKMLLTRVI